MKHSQSKGQTLIEAIISISIVVLLVTGLIAGTSASLKTSVSGRSRDQAVKLAEEGLEHARSLRDQSWATLASYSGSYCFDSSALVPLEITQSEDCPVKKTTQDTVFNRIITFSLSGSRMTIESKVSYPENAKTQQVLLTTYLTAWK